MTGPHARLDAALGESYTITREIGSGGMATVYLAHDVKHDREVALKVLRPELAAALGAERFPREIRIVAKFQHPHILSLYDSGETQGFLYYVMPFVEGESLADRLARQKQLPIGDVVRILREVADALAYAHARGVVHRDIKPGNVLLSGRHAVVTDFGVAKAVEASGGDKATTVGMAVGTPLYMSPEQAMAQRDIDARADIYSLGILGYEMLAGRLPFSAETPQGILSAHVMTQPTDIRETRPGVPETLAVAIMRCLEKNPADRWQTADELVAQLEMIVSTPSGGMTPTRTRPVKGVTPKRMSRRTWIAAAIGAVVLLGGGAIALKVLGGGSGRIERIGVLPIKDISGQDSVFVRAMHDALTTSLSQLGTVGVQSASDMMRFADGATPDKEVAKQLNLDALVIASVFRAGNIMRITVQFSDPVTTRSLWSDTYERDVSDVLAAQGDIVHRITAGIAGKLGTPASVATNQGASP
jgi:eukaryotic-like serine/threonine-protein kinase